MLAPPTSDDQKIARMASISTIFGLTRSWQRKLFFDKKIARAMSEQTNKRAVDRQIGVSQLFRHVGRHNLLSGLQMALFEMGKAAWDTASSERIAPARDRAGGGNGGGALD